MKKKEKLIYKRTAKGCVIIRKEPLEDKEKKFNDNLTCKEKQK